MRIERTVLFLTLSTFLILTVACGIGFAALYETFIESERGHLQAQVHQQIQFIDSVARFDQEFSADYPGGSRRATLRQVREAFIEREAAQHTTAFFLGRRSNGTIEYLLPTRAEKNDPQDGVIRLPAGSPRAEPMRLALAGRSGTMVGPGPGGRRILAAYAPVGVFDMGLVAVRDYHSLTTPYLMAGGSLVLVGIFLLILTYFVIYRIINPVLKRDRQNEARLSTILRHMVDGVLVVDEQGTIRFANPAAENVLNRENQELIGTEFGIAITEDQAEEIRVLGEDGRIATAHMRTTPITWEEHEATLVTLHDVTDYKKLQERLVHDALHDTLTDLPNRNLFLDRLRLALEQTPRKAGMAVVVFLDLDNFKSVNDTLSHEVGDELLVGVAQRLHQNLRAGDTVARFGGDEFVLLLDNLEDPSEAAHITRRILDSFHEPFHIGDRSLRASASAGLAFLPGDGSGGDLLRDADAAMYHAKELGSGGMVIFNKEMHEEAIRRFSMETELRLALESDELFLYFQPVVHLDSGKMEGMEALLRWSRQGELVTPSHFIPLAETTGLILPIGLWVMIEACRQLSQWKQEGLSAAIGYVAVNLSARQLNLHDHCEALDAIINSSGVSPRSLRVEMTESALMESRQHVIPWLESLRKRGIKICMDDFGTGYSSLSYLQHLPIDVLKIDRSFITRINFEKQKRSMVAAILTLAHELDIEVVAEGVETEAERNTLVQLGCKMGQGFLFSTPVPPEEAERWTSRLAPGLF